MKPAFVRIALCWGLAIQSFCAFAIEDTLTSDGLRTYVFVEYRIQAGFVPEQSEYVWGMPIHYFTLKIRNAGPKTIYFVEGGDYRGGRSLSNEISAVDANDTPVEIPKMDDFGGLIWLQKVDPGQTWIKMLPVDRRLIFKGPGVYSVTGKRTFKLSDNDHFEFAMQNSGTTDLRTSSTFQLTIRPYNPETMALVVEKLAARIRSRAGVAPKALEYTEPNDCTEANLQYLDLLTLSEIKDSVARDALIVLSQDSNPTLSAGALPFLSRDADEASLNAARTALHSSNAEVRSAAAQALGPMQNDQAVTALLSSLPTQSPDVACSTLRALGQNKSAEALAALKSALNGKPELRRAAVDGLVTYGGNDAIEALRACVNDPDLDFCEYAVKQLAQGLRQSIDPEWLAPVIRAREGTSSLGEATTLMRLHGGSKAVPALLGCLNFNEPSIRKYYNYEIFYEQAICEGGLKHPWVSDLNRDSTPEELASNQLTLKRIKQWVEHYRANRMDEVTTPVERMRWEDQQKLYGEEVDGIRIRANTNNRVWPAGMPQLLSFAMLDKSGSVNLTEPPKALEVELNGNWFERHPPLETATQNVPGEGYGASFTNIVLDEHWFGKSDGQRLELRPGKYQARIAVSLVPAPERSRLAMSQTFEFEILTGTN